MFIFFKFLSKFEGYPFCLCGTQTQTQTQTGLENDVSSQQH